MHERVDFNGCTACSAYITCANSYLMNSKQRPAFHYRCHNVGHARRNRCDREPSNQLNNYATQVPVLDGATVLQSHLRVFIQPKHL